MENEMNDLFNNIIQMNIYASIAIIVVVMFRALFKFVPKRYVCLLWVVVAVRLVCPYSVESNFSILNLKPVYEMFNGAKNSDADVDMVNAANNKGVSKGKINTAEGFLKDMSKENDGKKTSIFERINFSTIKENYHFIWMVGMLIIAFGQIINYVKLSKKLRMMDKTVCDGYVESEFITTPFTAGIIKPVIYIPKGMDDGEKKYVLLHEKIHVKNKDCVIKTFGATLLCVNWFNPFVWVAYRLLCDDLEMRCDEEVVKSMDADVMHEYCMSIVLHSIDSKASYKIPGVCFAKKSLGGMEVKMRIKNMFSKKVSKAAAAVLMLASVATVTAVSTQAKTENKKAVKVESGVEAIETKSEEVIQTEKKKTEASDKKENDLLMKYAKEYTDKGYVIIEYVEEVYGADCVALRDNVSGDNNEIIHIYLTKGEIKNNDDLVKAILEGNYTCTSNAVSIEEGVVTICNPKNPGVKTTYTIHAEDNVIVEHVVGLLNGIG